MHRGDRRARDGLRFELLENFRDWLAEHPLDLGYREFARKRRYLVPELRQLLGEVGGQEVPARRGELAKLYGKGAQRLEPQAPPPAPWFSARAEEKERVQRAS